MIIEKMQKKISSTIEETAVDVMKNSVGKSLPFTIHEVVLPKELRNINKKEK